MLHKQLYLRKTKQEKIFCVGGIKEKKMPQKYFKIYL